MDEQPSAQQETVSVEFTLAIGEGHISATAVVPAGQTNLTKILPVIQAFDDSLIATVASQAAGDGHPVSCKAGCGACCRQMVPISIFEAEALAEWIHSLPESQQQQLAQRFHQTLLSFAATGLLDRMVEMSKEDWRVENEVNQRLMRDYFYTRIPCPFLQDESCSIHPIRPLVCREYIVVSPAEHCVDPAIHPVLAPHQPLKLFPILNEMGAKLEHDTRGWIPLVFLFAWMKAGAHPGEAVSGTGPELLYEFVRRITPP
jgi:Fe-S-cluster containining protein